MASPRLRTLLTCSRLYSAVGRRAGLHTSALPAEKAAASQSCCPAFSTPHLRRGTVDPAEISRADDSAGACDLSGRGADSGFQFQHPSVHSGSVRGWKPSLSLPPNLLASSRPASQSTSWTHVPLPSGSPLGAALKDMRLQGAAVAWSASESLRHFGSSSSSSSSSNDPAGLLSEEALRSEVEEINQSFAEAREEIEMALESMDTVYFNEEAEAARNAVAAVLSRFEDLLGRLDPDRRGALQRAMGLKMEQLKGELEQLSHHEE